MRQEKTTDRLFSVIYGVLAALCMALIFWFSSCNAEQSSEQSNAVIDFLYRIFGESGVTVFIVRKSAHCLEYCGLSLLFNLAIYYRYKKTPLPFEGIAWTSLYAISDEIHQLFIDGRSAEITDWAIDTFGAVLGAAAFGLIYAVIKSTEKRRNK